MAREPAHQDTPNHQDTPLNKDTKELTDLLSKINLYGAVGESAVQGVERPLYGTTLFIAGCTLNMRMGDFTAYIFQDINHRGYIIALAYGDIRKTKKIYTRIHSSCVTSETLRGVDCDCVQQLEGALHRIAQKGTGILFYFMQEGRGVGYIAKARDRMLVQASRDELSTFAAYAAMGLKKDYRSYESISSICHLLGIDAEFVLMTNNPDKVEALRKQGLKIAATETIEYEAGPYNLAYLSSKRQSGHKLTKARAQYTKSALPPEPVVPFAPYALATAQRFIHVASYYLPMKPINEEVLLDRSQYDFYFGQCGAKTAGHEGQPLIHSVRSISFDRHLVKINKDALRKLKAERPDEPLVELLTTPFWFKVHVYYDLVSWEEFVVLVYGKPAVGVVPVVRLHSRSIFNSFPLKNVENRDRFKKAAMLAIENGYGVMVILDNDGRGAGFGAHASDSMLRERGGVSSSTESYRLLGVEYDSRDYHAGVTLLKLHLEEPTVQMIIGAPDSLVRKTEYSLALHAHNISISKWIFLDE